MAAGVVLAYAAWGAALAPWLAHRAAGDAFSGDEPVVRLERACRWNPLHAGYRRLLGNARLEAPGPSEWKGGPGGAGDVRDDERRAEPGTGRHPKQIRIGQRVPQDRLIRGPRR